MNNLIELVATMRRFGNLDVLCACMEGCTEEIETIDELEEMLSDEAYYIETE